MCGGHLTPAGPVMMGVIYVKSTISEFFQQFRLRQKLKLLKVAQGLGSEPRDRLIFRLFSRQHSLAPQRLPISFQFLKCCHEILKCYHEIDPGVIL
jgi:hypothetical protein